MWWTWLSGDGVVSSCGYCGGGYGGWPGKVVMVVVHIMVLGGNGGGDDGIRWYKIWWV